MSKKKDKKAEDIIEEIIDNSATEDTSAPEKETENAEPKEAEETIEDLQLKLAEQKNHNMRLYADFENLRKRAAKEKLDMMLTANENLMSALLPVLDDFDRAITNMKKVNAQEQVLEGVELIQNKFSKTLEGKGLKPMDSSINKDFDAEVMEAITKIPAPTPDMAGKIIDEVEKGYQLGSKIIRFPKVVVAEKAQ